MQYVYVCVHNPYMYYCGTYVCGIHASVTVLSCSSFILSVQASSEAEMLAHIQQVKDLELKLKARGEEEQAVAGEWRAREEGLRADVDQLGYRVEEFKGKVEEKELQCRKVQAELDEARAEV